MSYISLLNEGQAGSNSSFVAATDFLTVGRALTNYGVLTQLDDATFSGANGINTTSLISSGNVSGSQLQIAGQQLNADMIPEGTTNKFYTSEKAQTDAKLAISSTDSTEVDFTYTAGNITASIKDNSVDVSRIKTAQISSSNVANAIVKRDASGNFSTGTITCINGSSVQGAPYSAVFGQSSSTNSGQLALIDGTSNNQYAQLYCRSNVFGVQGNITSIALQKNTSITGSLDVSTGINISTGQTYKINNVEYLATKTTDNLTEGTTNKYYSSTLAQADAKIAISSTDSTEIDFTYTSGNITAILKDNTIDISRIKTAQIDTANTLSTLVKRDATTGGFNAGQVQLMSGDWNTDTPSIILGQNNGINEGVIQMWNNATTSILIEASTTGSLQLYQKVGTVPTMVADINPTSSTLFSDVNIPSGRTYKINNAEYMTTKTTNDLTEGTNLYYTDLRFDTKFFLKTTDHLNQGATNKYYATTLFNADLATKNTNDLIQGTTNKYYATTLFNTDLATKTTNDLIQGTTNKYYATTLFNTDLATKTTDNLIQGTTNKYYSSTLAQTDAKTAISATDSTEIDFTYTSGNITASLKNASIVNSKLANSSITIGSTSMALGSSNSAIRGSLTLGDSLNALILEGIVQVRQNASQTFKIGDASATGTLNLISKPSSITYISTFKQDNMTTSIDSESLGTLNLNMVSTGAQLNVGSALNFSGYVPSFNNNKFNNITKCSIAGMAHTGAIPITNWMPIGHTATTTLLQASIVARGKMSSYFRITVNIPLSNWGTTASNHHLSIIRQTTPCVWNTVVGNDITNGNYGLHHIFTGIQYDSCNMTYIDTQGSISGTSYYYCVLARSNTLATSASNVGNTNYSDITVEELF